MFTALVPVPTGEHVGDSPLARFRDFAGATVALVDNGKPRTSELLLAIAEGLAAMYPTMKVVGPFLTDTAFLASEEQLDDIAAQCDIVLNGLGDCGSCSASSIHVVADFAARGIPAIAMCTKPFVLTAREIAARRGMPDLPFVVLEHPLSSLPSEELRERAREAIGQVLDIAAANAGVPEVVSA
jgi:hypothetical protein